MEKYININEMIRNHLLERMAFILSRTDDNCEALIEYSNYIEGLQKYKYLYRAIIGLCFADTYRTLSYRDLYNNLSVEEKSRLEEYSKFQDYEDLEMEIKENFEFFCYIIRIPIKNYLLPLTVRTKIVLMEEKKMKPFDSFHELEKRALFPFSTIEEMLFLYKQQFLKYKNMGYSETESEFKSFKKVMEALELLQIGNETCFRKIVFTVLFHDYKLKKAIQVLNQSKLQPKDQCIISAVETEDIQSIIDNLMMKHNYELLTQMVMEYLDFCMQNEHTETNILDGIYLECVPEKVKRKLKEVYRNN